MYYFDIQIALQEVPGEISICFAITGCRLHCKGCHSPHLWKEENGRLLSEPLFRETLGKYSGLAGCVLFLGGEWQRKTLCRYLEYAREQGYKTCLYTGETAVDSELLSLLTWVKTGPWDSRLGGLDSPKSNQKFIEVASNTIRNDLFLHTPL